MYRVGQNFSGGILLGFAVVSLLCGCDSNRGGSASIKIRWAHDPETLDPLLLANQTAIDVNNLLNLSLLQADLSTQKIAPALAEALPAVQLEGDSLMRLRYGIRPAAAWDDGRPVLASDVAFTLKLMFCPGVPNEMARRQYRFIQAVLADPQDPRRFSFVCKGQALDYMKASGDFFILSEAALDPRGQLRRFTLAELQKRPATAPPDSALRAVAGRYAAADPGQWPAHLPGCGPYQLVKWEKDRYLTLRRKPHWWADKVRPTPFVLQARPPQLEYVVIPDAAAATLALRRGDLDIYPQMPTSAFARLRASAASQATLQFYSTSSYDVVTVGFNTRRPRLADALTRQALTRCFDAKGLLNATERGGGQAAVGFVSPNDRINYNDSLAPLPFDPSSAAALLGRAGWRRGTAEAGWFRPGPQGEKQQLRLTMRYRAEEALFGTIALQFQAAAAGIDVPVALQPTESGAFSEALAKGDFDVYVRVLRGNPFMFNFMPLLHSEAAGAGNTSGYTNPEADRLLEAIAGAENLAQRAVLLRRFQTLMQREVPMVPLFFLANRIAASRRLTGLHVSSLKPGYTVTAIEQASDASPTRP